MSYSSLTSRRTVSSRRRCSSVKSKSMAASESEDHLGDHVALDLVRAAIDRDLAIVEVMRRDRRGVIGADRLAVPACFHRLALERHGIGPERFHGELGELLLDVGALDLEDRALGAGTLAAAHGGDHAQIGDLERHELDLKRTDLVAEARIGRERGAAFALTQRNLLEPLQFALRSADAG